MAERLGAAREAQASWAARPIGERLAVVRRFRHALAAAGEELAAVVEVGRDRRPGESLVSEVLPLADSCRFLERKARRILAARRLRSRLRPIWLSRIGLEIRREPFGVILIIGPSNYPLMLAGIQSVQALVAGNAAIVKPGRGGERALMRMAELLAGAGLDERLLQVLSEDPEAAREAILGGVDKVILTGSAATGQAVLSELAPRLVPSTLELSGCDAVFVREDGDVELAARGLGFGLRLNSGATCIAPRRVFVARKVAPELEARLAEEARSLPACRLDGSVMENARRLIRQAVDAGARIIAGGPGEGDLFPATVLAGATPEMDLFQQDPGAPLMGLCPVDSDEEALAASARCPYALGATIFGSPKAARALALRVNAGTVVINDTIAPTADPRLPFGGRGRSGFGVTRGAEGLVEMTQVKAIAIRHGRWRPHFDPPDADLARLAAAYLRAAHGGKGRKRLSALSSALRTLPNVLSKRRNARGGRS